MNHGVSRATERFWQASLRTLVKLRIKWFERMCDKIAAPNPLQLKLPRTKQYKADSHGELDTFVEWEGNSRKTS